jgi:hypothetical protein
VTGIFARFALIIAFCASIPPAHAAKLLARGSSTETGMIVNRNEPETDKPAVVPNIAQRYALAVRQILEGDRLFTEQKYNDSIPHYREAIRQLESISNEEPGWNPALLDFRRNHCQQALGSFRESKSGQVRTVRLSESAAKAKEKSKVIASGPSRAESTPNVSRTKPQTTHASAPETPDNGPALQPSQGAESEHVPSIAPSQDTTEQLTQDAAAPGTISEEEAAQAHAVSAQLHDALQEIEGMRSRQALLDRQIQELTSRNLSLEEALKTAEAANLPDADVLAEKDEQIDLLRRQLSQARTVRQEQEGAAVRDNQRLRAALARAIHELRSVKPELAEQLEGMVQEPDQAPTPES